MTAERSAVLGSDVRADDLVDRILRLGRELQWRGWNVSISEMIDASRTLSVIDVADRNLMRECLRSTLAKRTDVAGDFDELFERAFPLAPRRSTLTDVSDPNALASSIADGGDLGDLAAALVDRHGGLDGEQRGELHHTKRVLRSADLAKLLGLALRESDDDEEIRARIEDLKRLIGAEVRSRLDPDERPPPDDISDVEFLDASRAQLDAMRARVRPIARRIATRLARRRQRAHLGRVDLRRTARRSLATGGVPLDVAHRRRRPHRSELFVLCDISGSIADFSLFMLTLVSALSAELPRARSFVFVDAVDEITELLERTGHQIGPWQILRNTNVIGDTGHSDYGAVFDQFWERFGETDVSSRATVLIVGDGRCNGQPPRADVLGRVAQRARAIYWMNPEPMPQWNTDDSEIGVYADHCRQVFEVRDLNQLSDAIERIV